MGMVEHIDLNLRPDDRDDHSVCKISITTILILALLSNVGLNDCLPHSVLKTCQLWERPHHVFPKPALAAFLLDLLPLLALCSYIDSPESPWLPDFKATPIAWGLWAANAMSHSTESNPAAFSLCNSFSSARKAQVTVQRQTNSLH